MPDRSFSISLWPSADRCPGHATETILQALERGGLEFPAFCRHGHCGLCRAALLKGTLAPGAARQPAQGLLAPGEILICDARPASDLELRLFWGPGRAPQMPARVIRIDRDLTGTLGLGLRLPLVQRFGFAPGQFVCLHLEGLIRAYSLANPPHERDLELHIRSSPGGVLDHALAELRVGNLVTVEGPFGQFFYRPQPALSDRSLLLVAGGTGYAPMKSILRHIREGALEPKPCALELIWAAETPAHLYDHAFLEKLASTWNRFHYRPVVLHPASDGAIAAGTAPDLITSELASGAICYLAGPSTLVAACERRLRSLGVPASRIYHESFGWDVPLE